MTDRQHALYQSSVQDWPRIVGALWQCHLKQPKTALPAKYWCGAHVLSAIFFATDSETGLKFWY